MDIKLHAKLAAYTKIANINQLPKPTSADIGGFVRVGNDGQYIIYKTATENNIDELFDESATSVSDN